MWYSIVRGTKWYSIVCGAVWYYSAWCHVVLHGVWYHVELWSRMLLYVIVYGTIWNNHLQLFPINYDLFATLSCVLP